MIRDANHENHDQSRKIDRKICGRPECAQLRWQEYAVDKREGHHQADFESWHKRHDEQPFLIGLAGEVKWALPSSPGVILNYRVLPLLARGCKMSWRTTLELTCRRAQRGSRGAARFGSLVERIARCP